MIKPIMLASLASCFVCCLMLQRSAGQEYVVEGNGNVRPAYRYPNRIRWSAYDPYYAVTSRVYAQADLIRAQGNAAVSYAYARGLHADAYSKELDNWMKELRVYWDRKAVAEQKKLELDHIRQIKKMRYLNDQKWRNSRFWDRLKNHPELSDIRIRNGDALNFLLDRLSASALPYQFDQNASRFSDEALKQLDLNEQLLSQLTLKQGPLKFTANQKIDGTITMWPFFLRWDEFEASRSAFEQARVAVVKEAEARGQASVASTQQLQQTLVTLTNDYHKSTAIKDWVNQHHRYTHFYTGDRFLQDLDREIVQLEKSGDIRPFGGKGDYDPMTDGDHVVSLLCFMNRNGIEFAAAAPSSEHAYHNLFVLMRGLYLTVAEDDDSTNPENLGEQARQSRGGR